ncbi:hypothetical protein LIER_21389 [Lithospermum erythrorhizon]|uniref:Uncharacterized protein n=1 Tax=Lithospermum erythrorhizon TaxID=34254 RepID=A0AAV3QQ64_LITER
MGGKGSLLDEGRMENAPEGEGGLPGPRYQAIMEFLKTGVLPGDPPLANKIQRQSLRLLHQMGRIQADHLKGLGASVPVLQGNLYPVWVPRVLVNHSGMHFTAGKIEDLFLEQDIEHWTASVSYYQANGQV